MTEMSRADKYGKPQGGRYNSLGQRQKDRNIPWGVLMHGVHDQYERMAGAHTYKRIFDSRLQPSAGSNLPIPAYGDKLRRPTHYHPRRPSLAEETLLVEISWRNIKHLTPCQTNDYVLFRTKGIRKAP
jgi:hypothetical protein